ncbi:hypothetical protein K8T06_09865 [bacterium]|nr:hypothetical protein [bacterium]
MKLLIVFLCFSFAIIVALPVTADPFVDSIVSFVPGEGAGFGQDQLPDIVLGPPKGAGDSAGSVDVLSLGDGGVIVLEFIDNIVSNGPGPDLIIFENAFLAGGNPEYVYSEVAFIEVSSNGVDYFRFPNDYNPDGEPINNPSNWWGFAGVQPCLSHPDNSIDPTDPLVSGGDLFDLDDVGLNEIRFIRIIDTNEGDFAALDDDGDVIYDPGIPGGDNAGFDLDAVAAVYSTEISPTPTVTPVATATPTIPPSFSFHLTLSTDHLYAGEQFVLETHYYNPGDTLFEIMLFIVLDVYGQYYFCPTWTMDLDSIPIEIISGSSMDTILDFTWPDVDGHAENLVIWGGLMTHEGTVLGSIINVNFQY